MKVYIYIYIYISISAEKMIMMATIRHQNYL